jgi:hypothetical protein
LESRWLYYMVGAVGLVLHLVLALPLYSWYDRLLAWIPLLILLVLLRGYVLQSHKSIPMLVLVALQIYIFLSLPQLTQEYLPLSGGEVYAPSDRAVTTAMVLTVCGELVFIFSYQFAAILSKRVTTSFYKSTYAPTLGWTSATVIYSVLAFLIYLSTTLGAYYFPLSIRYLMTQLFNAYLGLAILLYIGHSFDRKRVIAAAYILAVGMSMIGFLQGMLTAIVAPFVLLFLARWVWGKIFDFRWAIFAIVIVFLINPVKDEFRLLPSWINQEPSSLGLAQDRFNDWSLSFEKVWILGESQEDVYSSTAIRSSDLLSLTQAIDLVPDVIPYNEGEGMDDAMLFWIPRLLWPSKGNSTDLIYNRYGLTFGYLSEEQIGKTAVGISVFAEGYWNFGTSGVLIFLAASGMLLGIVFGNNGKFEQVSTLICIVYVAPMIMVLQALSVTLASFPSFIIGATLALRMLSFASRVLSSRPLRVRRSLRLADTMR